MDEWMGGISAMTLQTNPLSYEVTVLREAEDV